MELTKNKYLYINSRRDVAGLRDYIIKGFNELEFNEIYHKYYLHGKELTSVSKVVEKFAKPFDKEGNAQRCSEKYYNDPTSKYYQKTKAQILTEWDVHNKKACDFGHARHSFGEDCFYLLTQQYDKIERKLVDGNLVPEDVMDERTIKFFNDLPVEYIPLLCETKVYSEEMGYAGTFDLLLAWDRGEKLSQNLMIYDFKTNQDLFKNFNGQCMLLPFENLLDSPYNHYQLQLSLYQIPLENIGCKVIDRRLIYLNDQSSYGMYRLDDVSKKLRKLSF